MTVGLRKSKRKQTSLNVGQSKEIFISLESRCGYRRDQIKIGNVSRISKNSYFWRGKAEHRVFYGKTSGRVTTLQDAITAVFSVYKHLYHVDLTQPTNRKHLYAGPRQRKEGLMVIDIEQNSLGPAYREPHDTAQPIYDAMVKSRRERIAENMQDAGIGVLNFHVQGLMNDAIMQMYNLQQEVREQRTGLWPKWELNDPKTIDGEVIKDKV